MHSFIYFFFLQILKKKMTIDCQELYDPLVRNEKLDAICQKKGYLIDMDTVIYNVSFFFFFYI